MCYSKKETWYQSRERARSLILAGKVLVNQIPVDKVGTLVHPDAQIVLRGEDIPFVNRSKSKVIESSLQTKKGDNDPLYFEFYHDIFDYFV